MAEEAAAAAVVVVNAPTFQAVLVDIISVVAVAVAVAVVPPELVRPVELHHWEAPRVVPEALRRYPLPVQGHLALMDRIVVVHQLVEMVEQVVPVAT